MEENRVYERNEREKWCERGKEMTNAATKREEKIIEIEEKGREKNTEVCFSFYNKLMRNSKQKHLLIFQSQTTLSTRAHRGQLRTISLSLYY
jgi:hypothetical protein